MDNYNYYYNSNIGGFADGDDATNRKEYVIVQSFWTKPVTDGKKFSDMMYMCALSLEYAHRSGYKVHMHTDSKSYDLFKKFGYDKLYKTLDQIPEDTPKELFAAGKFYAMRAEGMTGKIHIDIDVFLKKVGVLDKFYTNTKWDVICQQEEDMSVISHDNIIQNMHILGYPPSTRPNWRGSLNTGIVGFNNKTLARKYFNNYFDALKMYKQKDFDEYKVNNPDANLCFDFILEQRNLSHMSLGYNVLALLPMSYTYTRDVANTLGYLHLQGNRKWSVEANTWMKEKLKSLNRVLFNNAKVSATKAQYLA